MIVYFTWFHRWLAPSHATTNISRNLTGWLVARVIRSGRTDFVNRCKLVTVLSSFLRVNIFLYLACLAWFWCLIKDVYSANSCWKLVCMYVFASKAIGMLGIHWMAIYVNNNVHYGQWLRCRPFRAFECYLWQMDNLLVKSCTVDLGIRDCVF